MGNFKFERYNYAKIGIKPKIHFQQIIDNLQYNALSSIFTAYGKNLVDILVNELKMGYANRISEDKGLKYEISDIDWEWTIITPERTYKSNETSSKKE